METEILNTLETIRGYFFIIMVIIIIFAFILIFQIVLPYIFSFGEKFDNFVLSTNYSLLKQGKIEFVIKSCTDHLESQPNNEFYNWQLAVAYYYNQDFDLSLKHFNKAAYLRPEWEEDVNGYVRAMKNANKSVKQTD